jgi:hypothetical protein
MTAPTAPTAIPSIAGLLTDGDRFIVEGTSTVWTVEEVSANPLDEDRLTLTVAADGFRQVVPFHFDEVVARVLA